MNLLQLTCFNSRPHTVDRISCLAFLVDIDLLISVVVD